MKNKFLGLVLLVTSILFMSQMVFAAVAEVAPAANSNHTGSVLVNCSYTNVTDITTPVTANSSFYTNQSGAFVAQSTTGFACTASSCTATMALTAGMDSAGVAFNCTLGNNTDTLSSGAPLTGITFDSSDPTVSLFVDLSGESQSYGRGIEYSCTTTDGVDSSPTETFAVAHPSGDETSTTSLTLQSVKLLFDDTDYTGDFVFTCTSTDYTGNSASTSNTVTVDSLGRASISGNSNGGSNMWVWIILGVLVIWLINKKK